MVRIESRRIPLIAAVTVGMLITGVALWAQTSALVGAGYDDAIYALVARAVADGDGFRMTHLPVPDVPAIKYPPLFPLSLVPFWWLAPSQDAALYLMKRANAVYLGVAASFFTLLLVRVRIAPPAAAAVLAIVAFASGSMMLMTATLLSEPLYLALLFATLWLIDRSGPRSTPSFVGVGVMAGLVFLTRTIGVALIAAVVLAAWRRAGRGAAAWTAAASGVTVLPWLLYSAISAARVPELLVPRYGSYGQLYLSHLEGSPAAALRIFSTNMGAIVQTAGAKILSSTPLIDSLAGLVLIGLALLGSRRLGRIAPATAAYPWMYLLLVGLWSFPPFRFLFALFPLLLALAVVSWRELAPPAPANGSGAAGRMSGGSVWPRRLVLGVGAVLLVGLGVRELRSVGRRVWEPAQMRISEISGELVRWTEAHTSPDAILAYEFDPLLALYTGRRTVPNSYEPIHTWYRQRANPIEDTARLWCDMGVQYVMVRRDMAAASEPIDRMLARFPGAIELIHVTGARALIFRVDSPSLARQIGSAEDSRRPARARDEGTGRCRAG